MNRIKFLREERGWTQSFLAEKMQFSRQVLSNYENEINQPSPDVLIKFADIFECSIDYLLGRSDDFGNVTVKGNGAELPFDAQELVEMFLQLTPMHRTQVLEYARYFVERESATKKKNI